MKLFYAISLFLIVLNSSYGQSINIGSKYTIHSNILNEDREYWVYVPDDYEKDGFEQVSYPVLYLLDGDRNFLSAVATVNDLSRGLYQYMPRTIIVGILNTERTRDLTPSKSFVLYHGDSIHTNSGGAEAFHQFLTTELRNHIDSTCRTNQYNMLMGHSFGGLFTVNTLLEHPQSFQAYMAHDPSLWWDDGLLLKKADELWHTTDFTGRNVYLSKAYEAPEESLNQEHGEYIETFCTQFLEDTQQNNLRASYGYFSSEDHGTIVLPATYQGFKALFDGITIPVKQLPQEPGLLMAQFEALQTSLGFNIQPDASLLHGLIQYTLSQKAIHSTKILLDYASAIYPQSTCFNALWEKYNASMKFTNTPTN